MDTEVITSAQHVRVLIAEPAELVREGICSALSPETGYELINPAGQLQDTLATYTGAPPDVVIVGVARTGITGEVSATTAVRMIKEPWPDALVITLAHRDAADEMIRAIQQGAKGALLFDTSASALRQAVRDVLAGGCVVDPRLTDRLIDSAGLAAGTAARDKIAAVPPTGTLRRNLSARERDVLRELSAGLRNKEIAARLGISPGTVKTHVASIFEKLQVNDRTAAAVTAIRLHLFDAA